MAKAIYREWQTFRAHPKATLFSVIAVVFIALGTGLSITFYVDLQERQPAKIAPLAKHPEINKNTIETFAQSLSTTIPADISSYKN